MRYLVVVDCSFVYVREVLQSVLANVLRWLMLSGPVELLFLLFLIAARTCSVVMFICVGCRLSTFLVIFSVCGVGLVKNSVDELFVEGTYNVFGVDVCVVLESYGVVVLLWSSFVG